MSLFCAVTANPVVVPATELDPATRPSPAACVPLTVSLLYCAPTEVAAAMFDASPYDAVAFTLPVYVQNRYGFDVAFPNARRSGSGMRSGWMTCRSERLA